MRINSVAVPMLQSDIDTDAILPARFLLLMSKHGLGQHLFHELRANALEVDPFVLDKPAYAGAQIILAAKRFGIGSSREQAVWALHDFGIRCIIAESFGEIFYANCINNGIVPITLFGEAHARIVEAANAGIPIRVDLERSTIILPDEQAIDVVLDDSHRAKLLSGQDDIDDILSQHKTAIANFEQRQMQHSPWMYLDDERLAVFDNR